MISTQGQQQFSALGDYDDGQSAAVPVTWTATGGTVSPEGVYVAGDVPGVYTVAATQQGGTLADTAFVTVMGGSTTYQALRADTWSAYTGDTQVQAAYSGPVGTIWSFNPVDWAKVNLVPDPIFGKALRIPFRQQAPFYNLVSAPDGVPGATIRMLVKFPQPMDGVWVRGRFKFVHDSVNQPYGWVTKSPNDPSPWGGSYKLFFLHWDGGSPERGSLVYTNSMRLDYEYYVTGQTRTATTVGGKAGTSGRMNELNAPEFMDREWYEFVFLHRKTGATTSRGGSWVRRLTTGAGTLSAPGEWSWVLKDYVFSQSSPRAKSLEFGGNKNHGNEFEQWIHWGPWEIVDAVLYANPFGVPLGP